MSQEIFEQLAQAVIDGEPEDAVELAQQALEKGLDPLVCINEGLTPGMNRVGEMFESGEYYEYYLPDLIIGGEAMKEALAVLEPALVEGRERQVSGRVVLGTVEGDLHEIGKTLVGTLLTANGFLVTDIGIDKSAADFVTAVTETQANIVGASALLTTTMPQQEKIIEALKEAGLRDQVKVMVGGAPVTAGWAEKVGADGYAEDAIGAVTLAKQLAANSS
jgi:corrinoid protein of di/trimethylamine methyltransferase